MNKFSYAFADCMSPGVCGEVWSVQRAISLGLHLKLNMSIAFQQGLQGLMQEFEILLAALVKLCL